MARSVTEPFRAIARPFSVAPEPIETVVKAMMFPETLEFVPSVAELPTCQVIREACAPPLRMTWRPTSTVNEEAIWKTNTAFELPPASSVTSAEVISSVDVDLYTPGDRVMPPRSPAIVLPAARPAALLYAVVKSD